MRLYLNNQTMMRDVQKLKDYDLENDETINIIFPNETFQIYVKTLTGKNITVDIYPDAYIGELKLILWEKEGYPPE